MLSNTIQNSVSGENGLEWQDMDNSISTLKPAALHVPFCPSLSWSHGSVLGRTEIRTIKSTGGCRAVSDCMRVWQKAHHRA